MVNGDLLIHMNAFYLFFLASSSLHMFVGWGAVALSIDEHFTEGEDAAKFKNLHGTFSGILVLAMSVIPMIPLRLILEAKLLTELQAQVIGLLVCISGLVLCAISLRYKILWLCYVSTVPTGIGSLMIFQRLVFNHQLWFKRIGKSNLGSGLFGFGIGIWTAFYFLVTIEFLKIVDVENLFYIYGGFLFVCILYPLCTIDDEKLQQVAAIEESSNQSDDNEMVEYNEVDKNGDNRTIDDSSGEIIVTEEVKSENSLAEIGTITDKSRLELLAKEYGFSSLADVGVEEDGSVEITYKEVLLNTKTWMIFLFFAAVLTPGWGIKLASFAIMMNIYNADTEFSAIVSAIYVIIYAVGRLIAGALAQKLGLRKVYDYLIGIMIVGLILAPQTVEVMDHSSQHSAGCRVFIFLISVIGLCYGGCVALIYSLVFEVYGVRNYKRSFSVSFNGFALSVIIGGLSSAYSFSDFSDLGDQETKDMGIRWYYSMVATLVVSWVLLHYLTKSPVNYDNIVEERIKVKDRSYNANITNTTDEP